MPLIENQQSEDAWRGLADAYTNVGKLRAAEATYKKAIALRPNYWGVYNWLGAFYAGEAKYSEAAEMFRQAAALAPDNYRAYYNLGAVYSIQGRYEEGIDALKRSIALRENQDALANLGYVYFLMRRNPDAVNTLERAVKLGDRDSVIWGNLGDALYWSPDRRPEALQAYRMAISLALPKVETDPQDAGTLAYLADYYAMNNDQPSALTYLQRALSCSACRSGCIVPLQPGLQPFQPDRPDPFVFEKSN